MMEWREAKSGEHPGDGVYVVNVSIGPGEQPYNALVTIVDGQGHAGHCTDHGYRPYNWKLDWSRVHWYVKIDPTPSKAEVNHR